MRAGPKTTRGPRSATLGGTTTQLAVGMSVLILAAVAGLAFVHRPWPNRLDVWGYTLLPARPGARWATDLVAVGCVPC